MKISYFFNISVVIGRSDMKQKTKNLLRPIHWFNFDAIRKKVIIKNVSINQTYLVIEMFHELFT